MNNTEFMNEIDRLHKFRYNLIKRKEEGKTNPIDNNPITDKDINGLFDEIIKWIKKYFEDLPFDFIMDHLANLGGCPCLINDDNGHWAVTTEGFQNVVSGDEPQDVTTTFFVEAKNWKNTPREALKDFLFNEE
jgi:hypothetical protein